MSLSREKRHPAPRTVQTARRTALIFHRAFYLFTARVASADAAGDCGTGHPRAAGNRSIGYPQTRRATAASDIRAQRVPPPLLHLFRPLPHISPAFFPHFFPAFFPHFFPALAFPFCTFCVPFS